MPGASSPTRIARARWAAIACVVIAAGLGSRRPGLPAWVHAYAGDALYATMVYALAGILAPRARPGSRALASLATCTAIEVSQAWHPAWLDAARARPLVALVLGRGFLWSDLVCYAVGVAVPLAIERAGKRA